MTVLNIRHPHDYCTDHAVNVITMSSCMVMQSWTSAHNKHDISAYKMSTFFAISRMQLYDPRQDYILSIIGVAIQFRQLLVTATGEMYDTLLSRWCGL